MPPKPVYFAVKTGFNSIFNKDESLQAVVKNIIHQVTCILQQANLFASYHVLSMLEAEKAVTPLNQTFFNRCIAAVTKATAGSEPFDRSGLADPDHTRHNTTDGEQFSALTASLVDYNAQLPEGYCQLERPAVLKDVSILACRAMTIHSCLCLIWHLDCGRVCLDMFNMFGSDMHNMTHIVLLLSASGHSY